MHDQRIDSGLAVDDHVQSVASHQCTHIVKLTPAGPHEQQQRTPANQLEDRQRTDSTSADSGISTVLQSTVTATASEAPLSVSALLARMQKLKQTK